MEATLKLREELSVKVDGDRIVILGDKGSNLILSPQESVLLRAFFGGVTFAEMGITIK